MINSGNIIKNPLTIIAIFAGIVEIGSNTVLPFLTPENQSTYIWFLMIFPFILVLIFFYILYNKHHVLYAPSDLNDEKIFNEILYNTRKSTQKEVDTKINNEIQIINEVSEKAELEKVEKVEKVEQVEQVEQVSTTIVSSAIEASTNGYSTINLNTKHEKFLNILKNNREKLVNLESKLLDDFALINNHRVEKNIVLEITDNKLLVDGFIRNRNNINIIEVKFLHKSVVFLPLIDRYIEQNGNILQKISIENNVELSFVIMTTEDSLINRYRRWENLVNAKYKYINLKIYPQIVEEINESEIKYTDALSSEKLSFDFL